jgi:hypothetical protein
VAALGIGLLFGAIGLLSIWATTSESDSPIHVAQKSVLDCKAISALSLPSVSGAPNTAIRVTAPVDFMGACGEAELEIFPPTAAAQLQVDSGAWDIALPQGRYTYRLVPLRGTADAAPTGELIVNSAVEQLALQESLREVVSTTEIAIDPSSSSGIHPDEAATISYTVTLPPSTNASKLTVALSEICADPAGASDTDPVCVEQSISLANGLALHESMIADVEKDGELFALVTVKLTGTGPAGDIVVTTSRTFSVATSTLTFRQLLSKLGPAIAGAVATLTAIATGLLTLWARVRARRKPKAVANPNDGTNKRPPGRARSKAKKPPP